MVVASYVTKARTDENQILTILENIKELTGKDPNSVSADKGYSNKLHYLEFEKRNITAYVSQRRTMYQDIFGVADFAYNAENDTFICPEGRQLKYSFTDAR